MGGEFEGIVTRTEAGIGSVFIIKDSNTPPDETDDESIAEGR